MVFDYKTLFRQFIRSCFGTRGTERRLSLRRLKFFAIFLVLFTYGQISSWIFLALDHIFFPRFRRIDITGKTLFIVGNFRSGSTFLHKLLAGDTSQFTALAAWEIYLAPSISQRKLLRGVKLLDGLFGGKVYRRLRSWDSEFLQKVPFHSISLWRPEEDVGLFLYIWYSLFSWFFFPDYPTVEHLIDFDQRVPRPRRRRVVEFYAGCIRRHLYVHGENRIVVSKNPSFSPMMSSLYEFLPAPRSIALVRDPIDTAVSTLRWLSFAWHFFADPVSDYPFRNEVVMMVRDWYERVEEAASRLRPDQMLVIPFPKLVSRPLQTVESIYRFLGSEVSAGHRDFLVTEELAAEAHTPGGRSHLADTGLDLDWLQTLFRDTIRAYGFSSQETPNTKRRSD